ARPLFVTRTCATLDSLVPVYTIGLPWSSFVLKAPPQELPQPPEPPEQPTATSAAARASRARLVRGRDSSVDCIRGNLRKFSGVDVRTHPTGGRRPGGSR